MSRPFGSWARAGAATRIARTKSANERNAPASMGAPLPGMRAGAARGGFGAMLRTLSALVKQALGEDLFDDPAVHVGQAEVPAGVAEGQARVIHAQEVQDGRVQVVHMDLVLDGVVAVLVGGPVRV